MKIDNNIYIPKGTLRYQMVQKCSYMKVLEVFFKEPTSIHFIKEISKKINLSPTSVRIYIEDLFKIGFIIKKESKPFDGYVANRENEDFLWVKFSYNLLSLKGLKDKISEELHPKTIILFGSYCLGEDVEESDIDILIISKTRREINLNMFEKYLNRKINLLFVDSLLRLDKKIRTKIINGVVLGGVLDG